MSDIRIICAHDAAKLAETITRLLEAEQHSVRLTIGRQALGELEAARESREAVILIWSPAARSQLYMLEWAHKLDPHRLIEIALTSDPPKAPRKAAVIDFSQWRGVRGNTQWSALNERLKAVARALNPPKPPPKYAALALGVASAAAVAGALVLRLDQTAPLTPIEDAAPTEMLIAEAPETGLGGPLIAREPGSLLEDDLRVPRAHRLQPITTQSAPQLATLAAPVNIELRDATLMERLNSRVSDGIDAIEAINPLRRPASTDDES